MSDTQALLGKIAALRRRLEQMRGLVDETGSAVASLTREGSDAADLEERLAETARQGAWLDAALRQLDGAAPEHLPTHLTARARRILERGGELLGRLHSMADDLDPAPGTPDDADPLAAWYRETVSAAEVALRLLGALPDAPGVQLRLCGGLEAIFETIAQRTERLADALARRREESAQVDALAELLSTLAAGSDPDRRAVTALAEAVLDEASQAAPLRLPAPGAEPPARFAAGHGLAVARVAARVTRHDPEWSARPMEPVVAALLHDVGMVAVPAAVLGRAGPLDDAERRIVEAHPRTGAEWLARWLPAEGWLAEAAADHHERLDGTGYPAGRAAAQLRPLARLLAVCDVYAALCAPRPYRPAREARTGMADTLLLAERGALDRFQAERLLRLSFYPVGSVVELADGAVGIVVATPPGRTDLEAPARPVVALLTDPQGRPLPWPRHLDLAHCDGHSIVRSLGPAERLRALGVRCAEWAA